MTKPPVMPDYDVPLVEQTARVTSVWWEWLQRYVKWSEACCEAGGGTEGPPGPAGPTGPAGPPGADGAGLVDGDKGDIVVSGGGSSLMFDTSVVTTAAKTVLDDTTTAAMLATLGGAPLASPVFTGDPQAPTAALGDADTSIATTAFVSAAVSNTFAGGMSTAEYTYSTTTTTPPSTGQLRANTTTQTAITAFYLHETNAVGVDITNALKLITTGVKVLCQDKTNAANVQYYVVTGPAVDNGVYFTIPVTWTTGGSNFTAGRVIFAGFGIGSNNMSEAPTDGQIYARRGSDASWQAAVAKAGDIMSGNLEIFAANPALNLITTAAGQLRSIQGLTNGSRRWRMDLGTSTAESTGDAGSNFALYAYSDANALLSTPISITRSSGIVAFAASPTAPTPTAGDNTTKLATTAFVQTRVRTSSTTAARPAGLNGTTDIGLMVFDTTLGKPAWWNGTVWKDATGTTV